MKNEGKKPSLETLVEQAMNKAAEARIPHKCWTCKYFTFKIVDGVEQEGVGNRGCRAEEIQVEGNWTDADCLTWELQSDPRKRKPSFISYYPKV